MTSRRHLRLTHLLGRFHEAIIYVTLLVVLKDDEIVDHTLTSPRLSLARLFRACSPAAARLSIGSHCGFSRLAVTGSSDMRAHKSCQEKVRYCRGTGRRFTRISADSTPHQPRLAS